MAVVFVDADNTLWDTNQVFADAQLHMLNAVEAAIGRTSDAEDRLAFVRNVDQALAATHHAGLRYPPSLLAKGLALALSGDEPEKAAQRAWREIGLVFAQGFDASSIENQFRADVAKTPALRAGVKNGLESLHNAGCVCIVLTEGHREKVDALLVHYALREYVSRVLEGKKTESLYARVFEFSRASGKGFMIGDQLDRDIAPAKTAGLKTIYFPGGFNPNWAPEAQDVSPDITVNSFDQGVRYISLGSLAP